MRQPEPICDPRGNRDGPVGPGGDDPVDAECMCETLDRRLVLRRDEAAPVGEPEARGARVAVGDGEPDAARAGRFEQAELRRPSAYDE
jgi:hypothetical protein